MQVCAFLFVFVNWISHIVLIINNLRSGQSQYSGVLLLAKYPSPFHYNVVYFSFRSLWPDKISQIHILNKEREKWKQFYMIVEYEHILAQIFIEEVKS